MINLVKNELYKVFHKKFIYILAIFALGFSIFEGFIISSEFNFDASFLYQESVERLESGNLSDIPEDELDYLVSDKTEYDALQLIKEKGYKPSSWQTSYIEYGEVFQNIRCMNESKYITHKDAEYETCKREYEENLKYLEDNDWKHFVTERLEDNKKELEELEALQKDYKNGTLDQSIFEGNEDLEDIDLSSEEGTLYLDKNFEKEINNLKYLIEADEYRLKYDIADDNSSNSTLLNQYAAYASEWDSTDKNEKNYKTASALAEKRDKEKQYYEAKYKIENGIFTKKSGSYINALEGFTLTFTSAIFYLIILAIVLGATMVTEEFSKGTIKQLLLKPYTRSKLLCSKIIASFIVFVLFSLFYMLLTYCIYGLFLGFADLQLPVVIYNFHSHKIVEYNAIIYALINYVSILPVYMILFALALLVGNLFDNTVIAIIVPFILYMFGDVVTLLIPSSLAKLRALLLTNCWNLNAFLFGGISSYDYVTLGKSLCVDVVFLVAFVVGAFIAFKKKDIKNQ